jgi:hypothetical protein
LQANSKFIDSSSGVGNHKLSAFFGNQLVETMFGTVNKREWLLPYKARELTRRDVSNTSCEVPVPIRSIGKKQDKTMKVLNFGKFAPRVSIARQVSLAVVIFLLAAAPKLSAADDTYWLMPPISTATDTAQAAPLPNVTAAPSTNSSSPTSVPSPANSTSTPASSVFTWEEVPENQNVPISRAVFDKGGYQLYDTVGETIVIPFKDKNLDVLKFGVSQDDTMYFVNTGPSPVLYVPENGYLENGNVPGAKWYPFTPKFQPQQPVYLGIMPTWQEYVDTGWYSDMDCYGGYWCVSPFGLFEPTPGFSIIFGGDCFGGWTAYDNFCEEYPAPFALGFFDIGIYDFGGGGHWGGRTFRGGFGAGYGGRAFHERNDHFGPSGYRDRGSFRGAFGGSFRSDGGGGGVTIHQNSVQGTANYGGGNRSFGFGYSGDSRSSESPRSFGGSIRSDGGGGFRGADNGGGFHGGGRR